MPVFILMIHAKPDKINSNTREVAGAYVNCFIEADDFDKAEKKALKYLKGECWIPIKLEEGYEVTEADYIGDPKGYEVYKQVLIDKEVFTFHTYETEDEEED